jgi:hypothetical protein
MDTPGLDGIVTISSSGSAMSDGTRPVVGVSEFSPADIGRTYAAGYLGGFEGLAELSEERCDAIFERGQEIFAAWLAEHDRQVRANA